MQTETDSLQIGTSNTIWGNTALLVSRSEGWQVILLLARKVSIVLLLLNMYFES